MKSAKASVIVATLNEEANIDHVMDVALSDEAVIELIIADGGSNDTTVAKIRKRAERDQRVIVVDNPDRIQSAGLNRAASIATGELLIRLDGHSRYASDYVLASIDAAGPNVAAGGPMQAEGSTPWGTATANAMVDPLAIGPARFHHAVAPEEVDTVYLGAFERTRFADIGGYRSFPSGTVEDTDFYSRWRAAGGTVIVDPAIKSWYHPRETWSGLFRQYFLYGRGKAELMWSDRRLPSLRPLAPAALVLGLGLGCAVLFLWSWIPLAALAVSWLAAIVVVGARSPSRPFRTAVVAATMHVAYGLGIWAGLGAGRPTVAFLGMDDSSADADLDSTS